MMTMTVGRASVSGMTDAERAALIAALQACRVAFKILQDGAIPGRTRIGLATEGVKRIDEALVAMQAADEWEQHL